MASELVKFYVIMFIQNQKIRFQRKARFHSYSFYTTIVDIYSSRSSNVILSILVACEMWKINSE